MAKVCTITVKDEVYCKIEGLSVADHEFLINKFSFFVEGYRFMPAFRMGYWDGRIPLYSKDGIIYFRLLDDVMKYIDAWGYEIDLRDQRRAVELVTARADAETFLRKPGMELKVTLRPYQVEAINCALEAGSGILLCGTGSGKTWMCAGICHILNAEQKRVLVIVPSADLVSQTAATFRLGKVDTGIYCGDEKDTAHDTVVATWQSLQNNPAIVATFDGVIVDECQGASAKVIGELLNVHGKNVAYRWGCTGTIPKPIIDKTTIHGTLGPVLFEITAAELIEMGYLARVEIEPVQIDEGLEEEFPDYAAEKTFLGKSPARLDLLADLIITKAATFGNTLVLVSNIKQGQQLQKLIKDSVFLYGTTENEVRAEWYSMFENRDDLIVIATFGIASAGISIDRIFCMIMIDAGKSFVRAIQSIGRSLRKGHDKDSVHCVDVHSKLKWSMKHWRERAKHYKEALYPILKTMKIKI